MGYIFILFFRTIVIFCKFFNHYIKKIIQIALINTKPKKKKPDQ